jgi:hypothetical protein
MDGVKVDAAKRTRGYDIGPQGTPQTPALRLVGLHTHSTI